MHADSLDVNEAWAEVWNIAITKNTAELDITYSVMEIMLSL